MVGISVPVPSVDYGAIVAALHIVWALRGRGCNPREARSVESWLFRRVLLSFWRAAVRVRNAARVPVSQCSVVVRGVRLRTVEKKTGPQKIPGEKISIESI